MSLVSTHVQEDLDPDRTCLSVLYNSLRVAATCCDTLVSDLELIGTIILQSSDFYNRL